ncbi:unnamed protein product [Moneuplotes crassus]|uniref:dolichyl-P-Man:Man5GlcNAc2-PP-dolichol alpha-1,3-mannosyltransferase n=1 Tax=Euplotes crassus TaxID=5936 RepID=A0AAD1XCN8_EUPCR|nr:unnamed protein product [Moneuplotes crassus]
MGLFETNLPGTIHMAISLIPKKRLINPEYTLDVLFTCNFIGICFARSLHYQFYSWYFHTIPWLLVSCPAYGNFSILIFLAIEVCWNMFPPSVLWSSILSVAHALILLGIISKRRIDVIYFTSDKKKIE